MNRWGKIGARRMVKRWTARDYVQNGLVNLIDGIENGGFGIHNEGVTTKYPLVDCITGAEWSSRYFYLTSVGMRCSAFFSPEIGCHIQGLRNFTVEFVAKLCLTGSSATSFIRGNDSANTYWPLVQTVSATNVYAGLLMRPKSYSTALYQYLLPAVPMDDSLYFYACYRMSTTANVMGGFTNGSAYSERTLVGGNIFTMPASAFSMGDYSTGGQSRLYGIRCYNRFITDDEVRRNSNIDRLRFNLP